MTIWTGKEGYNSTREFKTRTHRARLDDGFRRYEMRGPSTNTPFFLTLSDACVGTRVLDVGCGYGKWAKLLAPAAEYYVGIDVVQERIEFCEQQELDAEFRLISDCGWRLGREFDVAFMVTVLQHLTLTDAVQTLKSVAKHVVKGGKIFLRESLLVDGNESEAEAAYANRPSHMIPKPISVLKDTIPEFEWEAISDNEYVLGNTE